MILSSKITTKFESWSNKAASYSHVHRWADGNTTHKNPDLPERLHFLLNEIGAASFWDSNIINELSGRFLVSSRKHFLQL
jgi:hypothetical protein